MIVRRKRLIDLAFIVFIAVLFILSSASQAFAITPEGKQCPTAPVQTVLLEVKDCCGKLIAKQVRALKVGDKGFKQCRCAEKNAFQFKSLCAERFSPLLMGTGHEIIQATELTSAQSITGEYSFLSGHITAPTPPPPLR